MFDDEKVELLDGQIVYAAEEGPLHAALCARLARALFEAIPADEGEIRVGNPFALSDLSEPEPDFLVAPPQPARAEIVVHREPAGTAFGRVTRHRDGVVTPLHHPQAEADVRALLAWAPG